MNNHLIKLLLIIGLSVSCYANDSYIQLGASEVSFGKDAEKVSGFGLAFGADNYKKDGTYYASVINIDTAELNDERTLGVGVDIKIGVAPGGKLAIYGLASYGMQRVDDATSEVDYKGFGYGAGVNFKLTDMFSICGETKAADLKGSGNKMKYTSTMLNLKYMY